MKYSLTLPTLFSKPVLYIFLLVPVISIFIITACDLFNTEVSFPARTDERVVRVDVENRIFDKYGEPQDAPHTWGLGAKKITLTIETSRKTYSKAIDLTENTNSDNENTENSEAVRELDPDFSYTIVEQTVEGALKSISAAVFIENSAGDIMDTPFFIAEMKGVSDGSPWHGWTHFPNVIKFRLAGQIDEQDVEASRVLFDVCPRGGLGLTIAADAGETDSDYHRAETDRGKEPDNDFLTSGQIALQPRFREHPKDLKYEIFYHISDIDLKTEYDKQLNPAKSIAYPWQEVWSVEEMTGKGKRIGSPPDNLIKLQNLTPGKVIDASDPRGDGKKSYLINIADIAENSDTELSDLPGKYFVAGIVVYHDDETADHIIEVSSNMICLEIK